MTAFASRLFQLESCQLRWDLKSVNCRYLELFFKLPEAFQGLEHRLRDILRKKLNRGKVQCTLYYEDLSEFKGTVSVDWALAQQLTQAAHAMKERFHLSCTVSSDTLLRWPSVIKMPTGSFANINAEAIENTFSLTLQDFLREREREGTELRYFLECRLDKVHALIEKIRERLPLTLSSYHERLLKRIQGIQLDPDPYRLEQEMVFIAQRMDVEEELDRLTAHLAAFRVLLSKGGVMGRQLDFLTQELNREANTLNSKSIDISTTQDAVEMKVLIEQIREQVQNLE